MPEKIDLFEAIDTQRGIRYFKPDPVPDELINRLLEPAVQNILLAARGLGLGSVLTTRQTRFEKEIKQLLSIPDDVTTMALLPIGFPADGTRYGPTRRKPLEEVAFC